MELLAVAMESYGNHLELDRLAVYRSEESDSRALQPVGDATMVLHAPRSSMPGVLGAKHWAWFSWSFSWMVNVVSSFCYFWSKSMKDWNGCALHIVTDCNCYLGLLQIFVQFQSFRRLFLHISPPPLLALETWETYDSVVSRYHMNYFRPELKMRHNNFVHILWKPSSSTDLLLISFNPLLTINL